MKKLISSLLILTVVFLPLSLRVCAVSPQQVSFEEKIDSDADIKALRGLFVKSKYDGRNYAYYSPVKDENDTTKYPLIIFLHGFGHEFTYLADSFMPYWASEELQSKFSAGGAHILLPQIFHIAAKPRRLQALIENYIAENADNVDTDCVVIMGSSLGGAKAFKMIVTYPGFYSSAIISCPANTPKPEVLYAASVTPIWLLSSKMDILTGKHLKSWDRILETTDVPEMCSWIYFDGSVHGPNGKWRLAHSMAKIICYDGVLFDKTSYADIYDDVNAVNGLGEPLEITWEHGMIDWIQRASSLHSLPADRPGPELDPDEAEQAIDAK